MCRVLAYTGHPRRLSDLVITPPHSLLEQSQHATEAKFATNGDGFGLAWYGDDPHPGRFRDVNPAWSDSNLPDLCRMVQSRLFLAHVRASTSGATARANCHPFAMGPISFMHNGQLGGYDMARRKLEANLTDAMYAQRFGTTDSELLFLLMMQHGLDRDPVAAIEKTVQMVQATQTAKRMNKLTCVYSDGHALWAFRHASRGRAPTLYQCNGTDGVILASEPLGPEFGSWTPLAPDTLYRFDVQGGSQTSALRLGQFDPEHSPVLV